MCTSLYVLRHALSLENKVLRISAAMVKRNFSRRITYYYKKIYKTSGVTKPAKLGKNIVFCSRGLFKCYFKNTALKLLSIAPKHVQYKGQLSRFSTYDPLNSSRCPIELRFTRFWKWRFAIISKRLTLQKVLRSGFLMFSAVAEVKSTQTLTVLTEHLGVNNRFLLRCILQSPVSKLLCAALPRTRDLAFFSKISYFTSKTLFLQKLNYFTLFVDAHLILRRTR